MTDHGGCCHAHGSDALSRRALLAASVSAVVGGAVLSSTGSSSAAPAPSLPQNALVTLGVQAGPPPVPNRTGISSALKIGRDVYQIDCGLGSLNAFTNAGFRFDDLRSMFITHLHTDHIVDYFSFFLSGGYTASKGHYSPTDLPDSDWLAAIGKHYRGRVTVARDGQVFEL